MELNNGLWLTFIHDMCFNVWKCGCVGFIKNGSVPGFWLRDLICKFQSKFVVITYFLCWEIYISIFIYTFLIIWICYNILHEIFTGFKSTRDSWLLFLINFPLTLFVEGAFLWKKNSGRCIYYLLLFPSYHFAGCTCTLDQMQLVQVLLCSLKDLWVWQWKQQNIW